MAVWVEELGRSLGDRQHAIWEGRSGLPAAKEAKYRASWRARARGESPPAHGHCAHFGPPLSRGEKALLDLPRRVALAVCAKGHGVGRGERHYVCACYRFPSGCKGCPDFAA